MEVTIKKWGNNPSVRIPSAIMKATRLQVDAKVNVREEDGHIIIEPVREHTLEDLVAGINADNLPSVALSDQVKSLDWRARKATRKGKIKPTELAAIRSNAKVLIG